MAADLHNREDLETYDSVEENGLEDDLMGEVEEAADAARRELWGQEDHEAIMRNFLLRHVKNKDINFNYKDDKEIMRILKLKGSLLEAQYNYVLSQVRLQEDHGLTSIIVDNIANIIYKVSQDAKTRDRIQKDEKLRSLVNKKIGSLDYIPDWFQIACSVGNHLLNALANRRAKDQIGSNSSSLPDTAD